MKAMILAAGLGTRLGTLTAAKPKALVEVAGKPLLQHCIDNLIAQGFNYFVINVHHFASQVVQYLESHHFDAQIFISDESDLLLDTGGGILHAKEILKGEEPFLVHNVDILSNINLADLYSLHCKSNSLSTLAVSKRNSSRVFLFNNAMKLVGWRNIVSGEEKISILEEAYNPFSFSGIHVLSPRFFDVVSRVGAFSIVDAYLDLCKGNEIHGVDYTGFRILDVGKPESIDKAEAFFRG